MTDVLLINLEIMALSAVMVGLYALKPKLGLLPLVMAVGLLLALLTVGGRLSLLVPVPGGGVALYTSLNHLALLLTSVVLVYALEGTAEARRFIGAIVVCSLLLWLFRELFAWHLSDSALDPSLHGRSRWMDVSSWATAVSALALFIDGLAIIVVYQFLFNRAGRLPQVVSIAVALVLAMTLDGLVYGGLSNRIEWDVFGSHVLGKFWAGVAASIPAAAYISSQFRRYPDRLRRGVLERGTFEIVNLRRQVSSFKRALSRSRAEYDHVRSVFSRYVAPDVVDEILSDTSKLRLGGELRHVTILFSDIRGYSTLSEQLSPEKTIDLLNQYFAAMSGIITKERGTIIEFEGDAILCVFNAPLDQTDHAQRAVRTAVAMLQQVVALNEQWDRDGTSRHWKDVSLPDFKIRIGLHTGPVVVGNLGSEAHTKYSVIGDTVNTAARIEELNKKLGTTLLMSRTTAEAAAGVDFEVNDFGRHELRGRAEPVDVFSVWPLPGVTPSPAVEAALERAAEQRSELQDE